MDLRQINTERRWLDRVWIAALIVTVLVIDRTSTISMWGAEGLVATIVNVGYAVALVPALARPTDVRAHMIGMGYGMAWWLGRGFGFTLLAVGDSPNLWGSVLREGLLGTIVVVLLHYYAIRRQATMRMYRLRGW